MRQKAIEAVKASGITIYKIAKGTGIPSTYLYKFMHGEINPSIDKVEQILKFIGKELIIK